MFAPIFNYVQSYAIICKIYPFCPFFFIFAAFLGKNRFFVNLGGKNNAYLWLKYLIISTLISIIKVADVRIF